MEKTQEIAKPYEPTDKEANTLSAFMARSAKSKKSPSLKLEKGKNNVTKVSLDHKDQAIGNKLLMESLATADYDFINCIISQAVNLATHGKEPNEDMANYILSMIKSVEPRDQLETLLAAQMAAVHNAIMSFSRRLNHVETITQQDSVSNALNKLARTFATQIETLKRYRSNGEHKMIVQHVTVNDGGQAVIGQVTTGAGINKNKDLPHAK